MRRSIVSVIAVSGAMPLVNAAFSSQCCALVSQLTQSDVFMPNTSTYNAVELDFWSSTEQLSPTCMFFPDTPEKVSRAIKMFVENDCAWAIRGGGHSAIPGAANIHAGILMPMEKLKRFELSDDKKTVIVGAGNLMGDIYRQLDPHNLTAMIGRYDDVGLGVALGAGVNYLVNKEGLAVDNVINFEIVLADASIINANATSNADLFRALKGGSNNFGVVTAFTLRTEPTQGSIVGGILYYNETYLDQVSDIIYDYHVHQAVVDHLTHVLPQYGYDGSTNKSISFNPIVYNQAIDALPSIFQGWLDIPTYENTVHNRPYYDLSVELEAGFPNGQVQEQRVFSVYADKQLYKDFWDNFHRWCQGYQHIDGFYCLHVNMPITPRAVQQGLDKGQNILGLDLGLGQAGNTSIGVIYFGITFNNLEDVDEVFPAHDAFVKSQIKLAEERALLHRYIMLTYSGFDQPVLESYGPENVEFMKAVQAKYDPGHVFQRLVPGGQKMPVPA